MYIVKRDKSSKKKLKLFRLFAFVRHNAIAKHLILR